MPSFESMKNKYQNVGNYGQQLKAMSDMVMQHTFDNDIATRLCYIYDYYHDDQFDEGLRGYDPSLSKEKIPVKLKFIIKEYKSASKDDPEYHIMFEPDVWNSMSCKPQWFVDEYEKLGIRFPVGLYVDIPDDRGIYQKWLIFYDEVANQFPKFGVIRCNYLFTWIKDDGIHRYKRKIWGTERSQSSYTSGTWQGHVLNVLDEQGKFWLPWNKLTAEVKHDMRFFISMLQEEPYVYKASKIKNTSPKGIITVTIEQDRFDSNKDYVNLETGEMYADYYASSIAPEEAIVEEQNTDVLSIEAKSYNVRVGGYRIVYAKITDGNGNDVTNNYDGLSLQWRFTLEDETLGSIGLITQDADYRYKDGNQYNCKFKFNGDEKYIEKYIGKKIIATVTLNNLSASADLIITA